MNLEALDAIELATNTKKDSQSSKHTYTTNRVVVVQLLGYTQSLWLFDSAGDRERERGAHHMILTHSLSLIAGSLTFCCLLLPSFFSFVK